MILDPLFMLGFQWGIAGAALATVFAKVPSALIAFWLLLDKRQELHLDLRHLTFDKRKIEIDCKDWTSDCNRRKYNAVWISAYK